MQKKKTRSRYITGDKDTIHNYPNQCSCASNKRNNLPHSDHTSLY
jgi:hypothetical protein